MNVLAVPLYLAAIELAGAAALPAVLLTGLAGVAGVVAIGLSEVEQWLRGCAIRSRAGEIL
jgi:hypothetical protein